MSWIRASPGRRPPEARRRRRAFPLLSHARGALDGLDGMVLLPITEGRRRHRPKRRWSRVAWIAGAVLAAGLAAIALDEADLVQTLVDGSDPPATRAESGPGSFGPGNLGLPPPDDAPPPPPP